MNLFELVSLELNNRHIPKNLQEARERIKFLRQSAMGLKSRYRGEKINKAINKAIEKAISDMQIIANLLEAVIKTANTYPPRSDRFHGHGHYARSGFISIDFTTEHDRAWWDFFSPREYCKDGLIQGEYEPPEKGYFLTRKVNKHHDIFWQPHVESYSYEFQKKSFGEALTFLCPTCGNSTVVFYIEDDFYEWNTQNIDFVVVCFHCNRIIHWYAVDTENWDTDDLSYDGWKDMIKDSLPLKDRFSYPLLEMLHSA